jgi:hypothetical protein
MSAAVACLRRRHEGEDINPSSKSASGAARARSCSEWKAWGGRTYGIERPMLSRCPPFQQPRWRRQKYARCMPHALGSRLRVVLSPMRSLEHDGVRSSPLGCQAHLSPGGVLLGAERPIHGRDRLSGRSRMHNRLAPSKLKAHRQPHLHGPSGHSPLPSATVWARPETCILRQCCHRLCHLVSDRPP